MRKKARPGCSQGRLHFTGQGGFAEALLLLHVSKHFLLAKKVRESHFFLVKLSVMAAAASIATLNL